MPVKVDRLPKTHLPVQIQMAGSGGQGLILAGIILADAAVRDGHRVAQTQSYGPEARGGAASSEIIISAEPIAYPHVEKADILVALTRESCSKNLKNVSENGLIILDAELIENVPHTRATLLSLPIVETAINKFGREIVANMVALGALNCIAGLVTWPSLEQAVREHVPESMRELNKLALEAGRILAH